MTEQLKISGVKAREIIDCRGTPTVQVDLWVSSVLRGRADTPTEAAWWL